MILSMEMGGVSNFFGIGVSGWISVTGQPFSWNSAAVWRLTSEKLPERSKVVWLFDLGMVLCVGA